MKRKAFVLGVAASTLLALGIVATPAAAAVPITTIGIDHSVIYLGQSASIFGTAKPSAPGHVVYLQTLTGSTWVSITSAKLSDTLHYAFTVKPGALATYTLRTYDPPTSSGLAASVSGTVTLRTVPPTVHIGINHSVIHKGTSAVVSGYVSANAHGHVVYLQSLASSGWVSILNTHLDSASRYSFTVSPGSHTTYSFRVYDPPSTGGIPAAVSPTVYLTVQVLGNVTLTSYSGTSDYSGPTIHIPTVDYAIAYTYTCDPEFGVLQFAWNGEAAFSFDVFDFDPSTTPSASGTQYGHGGGTDGYFSVISNECQWSFRVVYTGWQ